MANYEYKPSPEVIDTRLEMTALAIKLNSRDIYHSNINENNAILLGVDYVRLHGLYSVLLASRNPHQNFMEDAQRYTKAMEDAKRGEYGGIRAQLAEAMSLNIKAGVGISGAYRMAEKLKQLLSFIPLNADPIKEAVYPWQSPETGIYYSIQRKFTKPDN